MVEGFQLDATVLTFVTSHPMRFKVNAFIHCLFHGPECTNQLMPALQNRSETADDISMGK
jgi:hypothetical protein